MPNTKWIRTEHEVLGVYIALGMMAMYLGMALMIGEFGDWRIYSRFGFLAVGLFIGFAVSWWRGREIMGRPYLVAAIGLALSVAQVWHCVSVQS